KRSEAIKRLAGERTTYCSRTCQRVGYKERFKGKNNPAHGKTYRTKTTHPEWAREISRTQKSSGRMLGDLNPMRRPDVAQRMSRTRRSKVTSDPAYREAHSQRMRKAWAAGKYDSVAVGCCKWYSHERPDG